MSAIDPVELVIDAEVGAAYIRLADDRVAATAELGDSVCVDVDGLGMVVGIEVLDLAAPLPLREIETRYHVRAAQRGVLESVRASLGKSSFVQRSEGSTIVAMHPRFSPDGETEGVAVK